MQSFSAIEAKDGRNEQNIGGTRDHIWTGSGPKNNVTARRGVEALS